MNAKFCNREGFTLLEVMIALAIVAIALVGLLGLSNRTILVQEQIQQLTRATLLAQQLISEEELASAGAGRDWAPRDDVFAAPFDAYRWQVSYEDTLLSGVKLVTVQVLWGDPERNEQVELTSFVTF